MYRVFLAALASASMWVVDSYAVPADSEGGNMKAFLAGVAVRDITPEPGVPLWGYSDREGPAAGTLDPLYAKALVVRAAGKTAALVSVDLGRIPLPASFERIRARAQKAGVDYVFMAATHTHHGPEMELETAPHVQKIETLVGDCIVEAADKTQPASIGIARTTIDIAHNRRILTPDGKCLMLWRNEKREPTSPVDKEAAIIKIAAEDGKPLAVLVHFACHPVVMGPSNLQYSADYVGELARCVKEKTGAECLFFQGACGNINPYLDKTRIDKGGVDAMRKTGQEAAAAVLAALDTITAHKPADAAVNYVEKPVPVGVRWDLSNAENVAVLRKVYGDAFDRYVGNVGQDLTVPLSLVVLNKEIAFVGMPGEIFVQYQMDLKQNALLPNTFLCGYANGYYAYFPTVKDAAAGGYGGSVATFVGLGAGDRLVTEAEIEMGMLLGKLSPICKPADFIVIDAPGQ